MPPIRVYLGVLHAAFDEERRESFARLRQELARQCEDRDDVELNFHVEHERRGSLPGWLEILTDAVEEAKTGGFTHVTFLPDDVVLCDRFVERLLACVRLRPDDVMCSLSNHVLAPEAHRQGARWYTTSDGFVAFAGTMSVPAAAEHLLWRKTQLHPDVVVQGDEGVNLWCMATGRLIYKPLPSLVQHAEPDASLDGSAIGINVRRSLVFEAGADGPEAWRLDDVNGLVAHLGRTYRGNHWRLLGDTRASQWGGGCLVERAYAIERDRPSMTGPLSSPRFALDHPGDHTDGDLTFEEMREHRIVGNMRRLLSSDGRDPAVTDLPCKPSLLIAIPEYQPAVPAMRVSAQRAVDDLRAHGYEVEVAYVPGQSLVTRARNLLLHHFLKSRYTALLQWDGDVQCDAPSAVRAMLETGHPIIGGAYPFRDGSGHTICGLLQDPSAPPGTRLLKIEADQTCAVQEIGTGFLLVRREVFVRLLELHPERLCVIDGYGEDAGALYPCLFDTRIVDAGAGNRNRYLSEDWDFCALAREAGYEVRCYTPPLLRHWGLTPSDGHCLAEWGIVSPQKIYEGRDVFGKIELAAPSTGAK